MQERDVAYGRLVIARGLVAREVVSECFRAIQFHPGVPLRDELVRRGLLAPAAAAALDAELAASGPSAGTMRLAAPAPGTAASGTFRLPPPASGNTVRLAPPAPPPQDDGAAEEANATLAGPPPSSRPASSRPGGEARESPLPQPGDVIDGYRVERLLGKGGMGAVFHARNVASGAEVALKVMIVEGDEAATFAERFRREMEAVAKVDRHAGIVRIRSSGVFGARRLPYAAMDFVRGGDLAKVVKEAGALEPRRAAEVVRKIASALHHCHEQGVLHRDLKPANVLVRDEDEEPLVADFGLARDESSDRLTKTGEMLGTPAYMAPEQAEGDVRAQDRRTDVYGIGAILYECLTGRPPFVAPTNVQLVKKVLVDDPADPRRSHPGVPEDLSVIALKCLAKEQAHRYQTAGQVADELGRFLAGEPIVARSIGRAERFRRRVRRHARFVRFGAVLGALVGALGLAAVAWFAVKAYEVGKRNEAWAALDEAAPRLRGLVDAAGFPAVAFVDSAKEVAVAEEQVRRHVAEFLRRGGDRASIASAAVATRWAALLRDPTTARTAEEDFAAEKSKLIPLLELAARVRRARATPAEAATILGDADLAASTRLLGPSGEVASALRNLARDPQPGDLARLLERYRRLLPEEEVGWRTVVRDATGEALERLLGRERIDLAEVVRQIVGGDRGQRPLTELRERIRAAVLGADERALARFLEGATASLDRARTAVDLLRYLDPGLPHAGDPALATRVTAVADVLATYLPRTLEKFDRDTKTQVFDDREPFLIAWEARRLSWRLSPTALAKLLTSSSGRTFKVTLRVSIHMSCLITAYGYPDENVEREIMATGGSRLDASSALDEIVTRYGDDAGALLSVARWCFMLATARIQEKSISRRGRELQEGRYDGKRSDLKPLPPEDQVAVDRYREMGTRLLERFRERVSGPEHAAQPLASRLRAIERETWCRLLYQGHVRYRCGIDALSDPESERLRAPDALGELAGTLEEALAYGHPNPTEVSRRAGGLLNDIYKFYLRELHDGRLALERLDRARVEGDLERARALSAAAWEGQVKAVAEAAALAHDESPEAMLRKVELGNLTNLGNLYMDARYSHPLFEWAKALRLRIRFRLRFGDETGARKDGEEALAVLDRVPEAVARNSAQNRAEKIAKMHEYRAKVLADLGRAKEAELERAQAGRDASRDDLLELGDDLHEASENPK